MHPGLDTESDYPNGPAHSVVLPEDALVLGDIGRLVPAKGIAELALAWNSLRDKFPDLRLLLCGHCERDHPLEPALIEKLRSDPRVHFTDRGAELAPIYAAVDVCVLLSHCEGLPNVVLESGAMQNTDGCHTSARMCGCHSRRSHRLRC